MKYAKKAKLHAKPLGETLTFKVGDRIRYTDPKFEAPMVGTVVEMEKGSDGGDYVKTDWMKVKWDATGKVETVHFTSPKVDHMEVVAGVTADLEVKEFNDPEEFKRVAEEEAAKSKAHFSKHGRILLQAPYSEHPEDKNIVKVLALWSNRDGEQEYVTWVMNTKEDTRAWGHYFGMNLEKALADFNSRGVETNMTYTPDTAEALLNTPMHPDVKDIKASSFGKFSESLERRFGISPSDVGLDDPKDFKKRLGKMTIDEFLQRLADKYDLDSKEDLGIESSLEASAPYTAKTPPPAKQYKEGDKFFPREGLYPSGDKPEVKDLTKPGTKKTEVAMPKKVKAADKTVELPIKHIKDDLKEFKDLTKKIDEMKKEDEGVLKKAGEPVKEEKKVEAGFREDQTEVRERDEDTAENMAIRRAERGRPPNKEKKDTDKVYYVKKERGMLPPAFKSAKTYTISAAEVSEQDKAAIDKLFTRPAGISDEEWFDRVYNIHFDIEDVEMDLPKRAESYIDEKTAQAIHAFTPEQAMNIYESRGYANRREGSKNPIVDEMVEWMAQTYRSGKPLTITSAEEGSDAHLSAWDAVATDFKVDQDEIELVEGEHYGVSGWKVEVDGEELFIFESDEDAETAALNSVRDTLESEPELFNQDWLSGYLILSDTDRRLIADEEADSYVESMDDEDILAEADMVDEHEEAGDDEAKDHVLEAAKEKVRDSYFDIVHEKLSDPIDYFVNELGTYSVEDLLKANFIRIDIEEAAKDAVSEDGVGHFLSSYDGELHELSNGMPYIRVN